MAELWLHCNGKIVIFVSYLQHPRRDGVISTQKM